MEPAIAAKRRTGISFFIAGILRFDVAFVNKIQAAIISVLKFFDTRLTSNFAFESSWPVARLPTADGRKILIPAKLPGLIEPFNAKGF